MVVSPLKQSKPLQPDIDPPVFVAIDRPSLEQAMALAEPLVGIVGGIKLGLELFTAVGPEGVRQVSSLGLPIFLDLKLHDIPNTVAAAVQSVVPLGVRFLTIHTSGGRAMMAAAAEAAHDTPELTLLGVTVLTSLDSNDLADVGQSGDASAQTERLAHLALDAGLTGLVCSPTELRALRGWLPADTVLMVPGIRPVGSEVGDQKRVMTPPDALKTGADLLVIGRPITAAPNPVEAAKSIVQSLGPPHS